MCALGRFHFKYHHVANDEWMLVFEVLRQIYIMIWTFVKSLTLFYVEDINTCLTHTLYQLLFIPFRAVHSLSNH